MLGEGHKTILILHLINDNDYVYSEMPSGFSWWPIIMTAKYPLGVDSCEQSMQTDKPMVMDGKACEVFCCACLILQNREQALLLSEGTRITSDWLRKQSGPTSWIRRIRGLQDGVWVHHFYKTGPSLRSNYNATESLCLGPTVTGCGRFWNREIRLTPWRPWKWKYLLRGTKWLLLKLGRSSWK